jgi:putative membrane protein insertion efficiency factor
VTDVVSPSWSARAGMTAIRGYQKMTSGMTPHCRFAPSCSHYTYEAIERLGLVRGVMKGARRVSRCHPWNPGGYDPVIDPNASSTPGG